MYWYSYLIVILFSFITVSISVLGYGKVSGCKCSINLKSFFIILLFSLLVILNTYMVSDALRAFISYVLMILCNYFIYRNDFNSTFINFSIFYLLIIIFEIVLSVLLLNIKYVNLEQFDRNILVKGLFSILTVLIPYFLMFIKPIRIFLRKTSRIINKPILSSFLIILCIISIGLLSYKFVLSFSKDVYFENIILLFFFGVLVTIIIYNKIIINNEVKKTEELIELITKYEKRNDEHRMYKHELLNNLLTLKSFKNKNTKKFDKALDDLISIYDEKSIGIKNIYKLPVGLKGMIYYKISDIDDKKYNIGVNISKQVSIDLENCNHKEYVTLCKIVGIVLDNAIEAMKISDNKILNIDIYKERDKSIIEINNSFNDANTDLSRLYSKNYSSKGKGRGLGLYIANILIKNSEYIDMEQSTENSIFCTKIFIK